MGTETVVKAPDMQIEGVSNYRLNYFKSLTQRPNPFNKRNSDVVAVKREAKVLSQMIGRADRNYEKVRDSVDSLTHLKSSSPSMPKKYSTIERSRRVSPLSSVQSKSNLASPSMYSPVAKAN